MALKFKCGKCQQDIIVQFLEIGEIAVCKNCGEDNTIPESAENIEDVSQDTLHRSPEPSSQPVESAVNEKDGQIDPYVPPAATVNESEQPIFLIGEAIRFGWNTMKSNLGFFIGILIVSVLIGVVPDVIERLVSSIPIRIVVGIPFWVLNLVIWMGLIRIALRLHDNKDVGFTDLFSCFPLFFNYLFGSILYGLIIFVGIILLIIPGIIWAIKFQFYSYFIVDEGLGPIEALKRSSLITKGFKWNLFLLGLLLILINVLGALCLLVGLFATIPTAMLAVSFVYRKLAVTDVKETD